jgi:hypothetical protein
MDVLLSLVASILTGLVTAYFTSRKVREDLEAKYDTDLRDRRLKVYAELWKLLEPLAKYSPPGPVTPRVLGQLSRALRSWYFDTGGLYLSEPARDAYFALQGALVAAVGTGEAEIDVELDPDAFEAIRKAGSDLRTHLAGDIGTRRRLMVSTG